MDYTKHAQLWKEEPESLIKQVERLPENAMIVEIGTADGGTAGIMYESTKEKDVNIYTIDLNPSDIARSALKETSVKIICDDSINFSKKWAKEIKKSIDFLLIDGDHSFLGVYRDYFNWLPNTNPNTLIVFHDYDSPERGGVAHFGVRIFIDTLIGTEAITDVNHEYRFLFCKQNLLKKNNLTIDDYYNRQINIGKDINIIVRRLIDEPNFGIESLIRNNHIDSLSACYYVDKIIKKDSQFILKYSSSRNDALRLMEALYLLEHACGFSTFPDELTRLAIPKNENEISKMIAKEQVRLHFLINILKTIVPWNP